VVERVEGAGNGIMGEGGIVIPAGIAGAGSVLEEGGVGPRGGL
jgi:hypothetical protein